MRLAKDDHLHCDTTLSEGCTRCCPKSFSICCDLCNPEAFQYLNFKIVPREKQSGKSQIKGFKMNETSKQLQINLFDWRDEKAITKFPQAHVIDFGGGLLLSDQHIQRILQCASSHKLSTIEALLKETHWRKDWADELGESLLSVIHKHYPPPSLPSISTERTTGPSRGPRGPMKCSKCHEIGHNGKLDFFFF